MTLFGFEASATFEPESHATMRRVVAIWSFPVIIAWFVSIGVVCLRREELLWVVGHIEYISAGAVAVAFVAALFGVGVFRLHEAIDRRIPQWEERHKIDHILVPLLGSFQPFFGDEHNQALVADPDAYVQRLFQPYIQGEKPVVGAPLVRRFYRALTYYWATQIVELSTFAWFLTAFVVGVARGVDSPVYDILWGLGACFFLWVLTYRLASQNRRLIRECTRLEINAILQFDIDDLGTRVRDVFAKAGIPLRDAVTLPMVRESTPVSLLEAHSKHRKRVFLSAPMASVSPKAYLEFWESAMKIRESLEGCGFEVFFAGANVSPDTNHQHQWEDKLLSLKMDLSEIERASLFVLHYPRRAVTSGLFELGYAVARGKQIVLFVRDHDHLPFLVQALGQMPNASEVTYTDIDELCRLITSHSQGVLGEIFGSGTDVPSPAKS